MSAGNNLNNLKKKFIGNRAFYRMVLLVAVPIMIQQGFTNFVSLLDNLMVGRLGTEQMSGVAIVNQLKFVFTLCIFGGFSGAGIFTTQYAGMQDDEGVRKTCRFKIVLGLAICAVTFFVLIAFGKPLISAYLNEGSEGDLDLTMAYAQSYLNVILWELVPFMVVQVVGSTLRECGETVVPMKAGVVAVFVNLFGNWVLIYGHLGAPALGCVGAAIATVFSRLVEMTIVVIWAWRHKNQYRFINGLLSSMSVDWKLCKKIFKIGSPLLFNELLWSFGMSVLLQCYSMRGLDTVAGFNMANTIIMVAKTVFLACGNSVGIIVGRLIGEGKMDEAVDTDRKIIVMSMSFSICVGFLLLLVSPFYPMIYNTTDGAKLIATQVIIVAAIIQPLEAFKNATYFTLRSGGRTWVTFFFDGGYVWFVNVPVAFLLSRFTSMPAVWIYVCVSASDLIKAVVGFVLVKKKVWLRSIVG